MYRVATPGISGAQLGTLPPATSPPLKAPPQAPLPDISQGSCPALTHLTEDRLLGPKHNARSPNASVPSSTKSLNEVGSSRSLSDDASRSKLKGKLVRMHADESAIMNETLFQLRFELEKRGKQLARVIDESSANARKLIATCVTLEQGCRALTQRMDAITERSMADNKTISELDDNLRRLES